ncbi:MAG TPA: MFS transporter [Bacillales bacterium]|nr:MFS transporter [Bacillales bacterium]
MKPVSTAVSKYTMKDIAFWRMAFGLALASFFIFASLYAVQPLLPLFSKQFDISPAAASLTQSLPVLSLTIGLILFGFLSDRLGRVRLMQLCFLVSMILFLLIPATESFTVLLAFRFIQGFALAGLPAAALAYISEEVERASAGFAISVYIAGNALGGLAGRVVTGYVAGTYDWRLAVYMIAGTGLFIFFALLFLLPKSRHFQPAQASFSADIHHFIAHLRNRRLLPLFGLAFILQLAFTGTWTYIPFYLLGPPFSLSLSTVSFFYLAYLFGVIGAPVGGYLTKRFGIKKVMFSGIFICLFGVILTTVSTLIFVAAALSFVCFGFFIAHSMASAMIGQAAGHHKAGASGVYFVSYYLGVAAGGTMLGPLWTTYGWKGIIAVTFGLPVIYVLFLMKSE